MIKNLTPHELTVMDTNHEVVIKFPKCDLPPRLTQETVIVDSIDSILISKTQYGETVNLPLQEPDTYLIVSRMVLEANRDRKDLLGPNELVRDEKGLIIGCMSLSCN